MIIFSSIVQHHTTVYQCLAGDILCPVQLLTAIFSLDILHLHKSILCVLSCLPVSCLIFFPFQYSRHFLYSSPAQPLGPEDLVWKMVCYCFLSLFMFMFLILFLTASSHKEHNIRLAR